MEICSELREGLEFKTVTREIEMARFPVIYVKI